jgi:hypothetical protein
MLARFGKGGYRLDGSLATRIIHAASLVIDLRGSLGSTVVPQQ